VPFSCITVLLQATEHKPCRSVAFLLHNKLHGRTKYFVFALTLSDERYSRQLCEGNTCIVSNIINDVQSMKGSSERIRTASLKHRESINRKEKRYNSSHILTLRAARSSKQEVCLYLSATNMHREAGCTLEKQ
jgi:hypothetical protein